MDEQRRRQSDTCSKKIAEKLLQGWALLNDTCPMGCPVPLVRNKQKEMMCVNCGTWAIRSEDSAQVIPQPSSSSSTANPSSSPSPPENLPGSGQRFKGEPEEKKRRVLEEGAPSLVPSVVNTPASLPSIPPLAPPPLHSVTATPLPTTSGSASLPYVHHQQPIGTLPQGGDEVVLAALDVLFSKLARCTRLLEASSTRVEELAPVCRAITELSQAIESLSRLVPSRT